VNGYYQGSLATGSGVLSLVKSGSGNQTLAAANSYTGTTLINEGALVLNGAGTVGSGKVTLASGSTLDASATTTAPVSLAGGLGGSGTINATGKTLSVGASFTPVALAITGNITLSANTTTNVIAGSSPATTSQTAVTGALVNNGALTITADSGHTFANGQSYTFFTATGGITSGFTSVSAGSLALTNNSSGVWTASSDGLTYTYTESTATLTVASPLSVLESWRQQYFGSADNSGNGADQADFDSDGIVNLMEYALGSDPTAANSSLVSVGREGNFLTLTYSRRSPADPAITYTVQGSSDLTAGFTAATGNTSAGTPSVYTDNVDVNAAGTRRFLRLSVTYSPAP
jgi:autotransporter-associated beta strand protein